MANVAFRDPLARTVLGGWTNGFSFDMGFGMGFGSVRDHRSALWAVRGRSA